ncbi:hypothetical protein BT93_L0720 [Corymbia citriodora subsp. variegata]|uniref:Protein kinase domain-containing protein n=1 Tax=Corymbia citriodora subsp. variegata TaxID=360336 RepID=A0A8T0CPC4_CORYI|nr:hypothetical protein BT93_L0720 [Corymbia citriodora subsp. variegata]
MSDEVTRKRIALGVARGLAHLHDQGNVKIIHQNICPLNILLNTQFEAVIGGIEFATIMHDRNAKEGTIQWRRLTPPERFSSSSRGEDLADSGSYSPTYHLHEDVYVDGISICGTLGYIAPECYYTVKRTVKNDVFAYGRLLLVLILGQPFFELNMLASDKNLSLKERIGNLISKNELGRVIDPNLQGNYVEEEAWQLVRLALLCADDNPSVRPKMSEVVKMIENPMLGQDPSRRSNWSGSEYDSTPYYSFPPSPSLSMEIR